MPSSRQIRMMETAVPSVHGSTASTVQLLNLYPCRPLYLEADLCLERQKQEKKSINQDLCQNAVRSLKDNFPTKNEPSV